MPAYTLPTAAELNLWDMEVPEGMSISVMPPAQEHMWDPFWWDQGGRDPLDQRFILRKDPGPERTEKLRRIIDKYPRYGPKMFEKCAEAGRVDLIRELLALGASMDIDKAKGSKKGSNDDVDNNEAPMANMVPAIHIAALGGHMECVQVLVEEAGVDVDFEGQENASAITWAAAKGHFDIVQWLLVKGAHICFKREGPSDIQAAVTGGNTKLTQLLLADEQTGTSGYSMERDDCLPFSVLSGNFDMVKLVLEHAGFPSPPRIINEGQMATDLPVLSDDQRESLIHCVAIAIEKGSRESVDLLLSYLTPRQLDGTLEFLTVPDNIQVSCFNATEDAMSNLCDDPELFKMVWETLILPPDASSLNQAQKDEYEERLNRRLISAAAEGCPQIARVLCEKYGADVNHVSHKYFSTPLGRTAVSSRNPLPGRLAVAEYLLTRPELDIHLAIGEYSNGPTALALAIGEGQGQIELTRLLLKYGGPIEEIDREVIQRIFQQTEGEEVKLYLIRFQNEPRFPVRLVTKEDADQLMETTDDLRCVEFTLKRTDLDQFVSQLQIRKSDAVLAVNDLKKRPLNKCKPGDEDKDLEHTLRYHLKDQDFSQMDTT